MKLTLITRLFPELDAVSCAAESARVLQYGLRELGPVLSAIVCVTSATYSAVVALWAAGVLPGLSVLSASRILQGNIGVACAVIVGYLCIGCSVVIVMIVFCRSRLRAVLRQSLVHMGHRLCVQCGYSLQGNANGRCPECGSGISRGNGTVRQETSRSSGERPETNGRLDFVYGGRWRAVGVPLHLAVVLAAPIIASSRGSRPLAAFLGLLFVWTCWYDVAWLLWRLRR